MPSSKRRSSSGGGSTPSKPPIHASPTPARDYAPRTPDSNTRIKARAGNEANSCDLGFTGTVVAVENSEGKGKECLWMSEAAMVSAPVPTGSLIAVSVVSPGSGDGSGSGPLSSLQEICNSQCGVEMPYSDAVGTLVAVAMAWPSKKLVRNEVRLSRVLASTLGSLPLGSTVAVKLLKVQSSTASLMHPSAEIEHSGARSAILYDSDHVSLRWCPPSEVVLATGSVPATRNFPSFSENDISVPSPSPQTPRRYGSQESENGPARGRAVSASPVSPNFESPVRTGLRTLGDKSGKANLDYQRNEGPSFKNWASVWAPFDKGKEKVKGLLESFATRWLAGRYLLPGNLVHIPLSGCDCIFLVTAVKSSVQTTHDSSDSSEKIISCSPSGSDPLATRALNEVPLTSLSPPLAVYLVRSNTTITMLPPLKHEPAIEAGQESVCDSPTSEAVEEYMRKGLEVDVNRLEYSALGGLSVQIKKLKQHVELSLLFPDRLIRYGLQPVRGVLLHGPPGTGKSSLARAAACEAGVKLFAINGPEIVSEFYGESEAALRAIFASAAKATPSVVFIDELDALFPARKDGSEELGQRMVATLLTLMDGGAKETLEGVLVIAASNRIEAIDPALRRPGRFDVEIEIGVPSPMDRHSILQVLLQDMQHGLEPSDVADLAATSHGFVGADLAALCNEAAMSALRRSVYLHEDRFSVDVLAQSFADFLISLDSSKFSRQPVGRSVEDQSVGCTTISEGPTHPLKVMLEDFQVSKTKVRPSAMREVALEVPRVRWSDIGGQDDVKQKLREIVEWPQKQSVAISRMGVDPPRGVLLYGPPGCSKTLMARAVASETGLNFIAVKGPELFSKWVGESEKAVQTLFARARAAAPSVIFFDEIDGLAVKRESVYSDGVSVGDRVMSQLLTEMDGLVPMKGVAVIAATNRLDIIDQALLRPGRFDRVLYVGPPDEAARQEIFSIHLRQMACGQDVSPGTLAALSVNYTGADIFAVCQEAALAALAEDLDAKEIKMCHFYTALGRVQPSMQTQEHWEQIR